MRLDMTRKYRFRSMGASVAVVLSLLVPLRFAVTSAGASLSASDCGSTSPGSTTLSLSVQGFERTVIVHVPKNFTNLSPTALVLNLHGSGSTALEQEKFTGMNRFSNEDGFIVAYPQALIPDGSGFDWNVPNASLVGGRAVPHNAANDVKFLTSLVAMLELKYCVNSKEVFAAGFSGGAREVSQLACSDSTVFAAIAPVSGLRLPKKCSTSRAMPVLTFHGSADPVDPFAGHGQRYWTYSVTNAAKEWATHDQCTTHTTTTIASTVRLTTYSACADGANVELYEIIGEGHEWPGGPTLPVLLTTALGPQSNAISANEIMWSFFQAHPMP
jgi:polyhydroxybutyrate depolymerase